MTAELRWFNSWFSCRAFTSFGPGFPDIFTYVCLAICMICGGNFVHTYMYTKFMPSYTLRNSLEGLHCSSSSRPRSTWMDRRQHAQGLN